MPETKKVKIDENAEIPLKLKVNGLKKYSVSSDLKKLCTSLELSYRGAQKGSKWDYGFLTFAVK